MKLRYRLFVWVGTLFVIAFVASFYVEERVTRTSLEKTRKSLLEELYTDNEHKRQAIEKYIADMLWRIQAQVDATLQGIAKYPLIENGFKPNLENFQNKTWLSAASLMITNQWVGFVQNTSDDGFLSELLIHTDSLSDTYHFKLNPKIDLVALRDSDDPSQWKGPYIGIPLELIPERKNTVKAPYRVEDESYYVFFEPETILQFEPPEKAESSLALSVNLLEPFLKWIKVPSKIFFLEPFIKHIEDAQAYLKANLSALPSKNQWQKQIEERNQKKPQPCFTFLHEKIDPTAKHYQKEVMNYVMHNIEHYNKVGLIWGISALAHSKIFGVDPIGSKSPIGMGIVDHKKLCGKALMSKSVFTSQPDYPVEKALKEMKTVPDDFLTTHLDVITAKKYKHVFFGNTLKLEAGEKTGYLTLAAHGGPVLSALARSTDQMAFFVSKGTINAIADPDGIEMPADSPWYQIPIQNIMNQTSGIIHFQGKDYFFLHIAPYRHLDLHFFIFNLKENEFKFIDSINEGSKELIRKVSLQMRLASLAGLAFVLIFLNNIAKRVTRPIAHLAEVTQVVAEDKLHEIEIPEEPKSKRKDEVYTLYHAFFEMVKGLKEKEKVRGVLNKVVSKEIAEETLKGNVQLGGEEKQVTVFFADIRNFSHITEHMKPTEVIELVNSCMTKASEIIDKYGGVIDKYVGDEVMALFGAPIEKKESALHAIECAVDILEVFRSWNQQRGVENKPIIELGIGIHTGTVVAGNMGAENRLNYTVLGSNVNLASRLCSRAQPMQVLITQATLEQPGVKERFEVHPLEPIVLKGFTDPVPVYGVKSYKP